MVGLEETLNEVSDWSPGRIRVAQQQVYTVPHVNRCVQTGRKAFPVSQSTSLIILKIDLQDCISKEDLSRRSIFALLLLVFRHNAKRNGNVDQ
mgnify:CR=1 FL=1